MASYKKTVLKKATSKNMSIFLKHVMMDVKKVETPTIKKNNIVWGGYNITFLENDKWEFSLTNHDIVHQGKFPSGVGNIANIIQENVKVA